MTRIAIFVSGGGTNCENIIRYFEGNAQISVELVLSNREDAFALVRAQRLGVRTLVVGRSGFYDPDVLLPLLKDIDFIVLAGFLWMVPDWLTQAYHRRMLNIHPALLPKYGGKGMYGHHVHEAVKAAGEKESGITIHYVSEECDGGEIVFQARTPLTPADTPSDIADKIHVLEQRHFPEVIEQVILGGTSDTAK